MNSPSTPDNIAPPPDPRMVACGWVMLLAGLVVFVICAVFCAATMVTLWCDGMKACQYADTAKDDPEPPPRDRATRNER